MPLFTVYHDTLNGVPVVVESAEVQTEVESIEAIRGTAPTYRVRHFINGAYARLPIGAQFRFTLKVTGKFDGPAVVFAEFTVRPDTEAGYYESKVSYNTTAVNGLLNSPDGDENNDVAEIVVMGAFAWRLDGEEPVETKRFVVAIDNALNTWDESAPEEAGPDLDGRITDLELTAPKFLKGVSLLTGGGASNLDGVPTADFPTGKTVVFVHAVDGTVWYELFPGEEVENSPDVIIPDDDPARYWKRIS